MIKPERITDYTISNFIIGECWDEISEDDADDYKADLYGEYWIGLYEPMLIGCYRLHQINKATWQIHAFILPEHRREYSKESGASILQWCLDNLDFEKLICIIPDRFPNVVGFVESIGFKHEGTNRQSYTKDGQLWDLQSFGLTKEEIKGIL